MPWKFDSIVVVAVLGCIALTIGIFYLPQNQNQEILNSKPNFIRPFSFNIIKLIGALLFAPIAVEFLIRVSLANMILEKYSFGVYLFFSISIFVLWENNYCFNLRVIYYILLGLFFCIIYRHSKTFIPVMIVHFIINFVMMITFALNH